MLRGFNGGCKDQNARLLLEESITLRLWLEHLGLELAPASTLSDNLNAVSNQTRALIHQVQLRSILEQGLDDFQKSFIDSTAVSGRSPFGRSPLCIRKVIVTRLNGHSPWQSLTYLGGRKAAGVELKVFNALFAGVYARQPGSRGAGSDKLRRAPNGFAH